MAKISFDLVSPENLIFNDEVGMIIVPGKDGDLGVLPGHSKLLSSLRPGRIMVYREDKYLLKSFFVIVDSIYSLHAIVNNVWAFPSLRFGNMSGYFFYSPFSRPI